MRKSIAVSLFLVFLSFFIITQGAYAAENTWRIGTILPLTGPNAKNGIKNFDGVKIATDMINEAGGVLGKKVVLVSADAPTPEAAASEANRLITNEKLTVILGTQSSGLAMAATVVAEKNKAFYIETEGISDDITGRGFKYIFRTTMNSQMMGNQMVEYSADAIAKKLGKKAEDLRFAIIHEDGGFGTSSAKHLIARAKELGLNVVVTEAYSSKSADLSSLVLKLRQAKPDILLTAQYINDSILFHKQMAEMKFKPVVVGTTAGQGNPDFFSALKEDANGVLAGGIPAEISIKGLGEQQRKDAGDFVKRYEASHNGEYPNPTSFVGFAGAWILYQHILPKAGGLDSDKLREAALSLNIPRGQGVLNWGIKFAGPDEKNAGQNLLASAGINQWQNGQLKLVFPKEVASSELK